MRSSPKTLLYGTADTDLDGDVDFVDFQMLSSRFGQKGGWRDGNFGLNDSVNIDDFFMLSSNFVLPETMCGEVDTSEEVDFLGVDTYAIPKVEQIETEER